MRIFWGCCFSVSYRAECRLLFRFQFFGMISPPLYWAPFARSVRPLLVIYDRHRWDAYSRYLDQVQAITAKQIQSTKRALEQEVFKDFLEELLCPHDAVPSLNT
jgi:hypothetical protein